jgi:hypothetical protein
MENVAYLRRQAAFCLRLSQFCQDDPFAERLRTMAAGLHERALTAEFVGEFRFARDDRGATRLEPADGRTEWRN